MTHLGTKLWLTFLIGVGGVVVLTSVYIRATEGEWPEFGPFFMAWLKTLAVFTGCAIITAAIFWVWVKP